jgi:hypothetical protein
MRTRPTIAECSPKIVSKPESSPRFMPVQAPDWLLQAGQQIQVLDYELHAAIRNLGKGEMTLEQVDAFVDACLRRDELMVRILNHLADQGEQAAFDALDAMRKRRALKQTPIAE